LYVPKFNQQNDIEVLRSLIKSRPLGAWTTIANGDIEVNHIPFILHEDRGEFGTLVGHVARSNTVWKNFSEDKNSVIVFQGEQAYITPSWYPSKHQHGKVVPTWNYMVVHAEGIPKLICEGDRLLEHLNELTNTHEAEQALPWKVSDAPQEFINKLRQAIVGIEVPIRKLTGKWKLGQNRPAADQLGIISGLTSGGDAQSNALALELKKHIQSKP